ncbi:MAG TPA: phage holin family protein [Candidatus Sulfotelmatobacter sp.]|nr:phage holin family protein [Candidatus Sulfotelmatobacter sp.]
MEDESPRPSSGGLLGSLRRLTITVVEVVETRLALISTDMHEARLHWVRIALMAFGVLICLQAGLLLAVVFVVLLLGQKHQLAAIGGSALALLLAAGIGVLWLRSWLKSRPPLFASTIAELRKDRDRLRGRS